MVHTAPMPQPSDIEFVLLGNTAFRGLFQREHALALELAKRGYRVSYIEPMPSMAAKARRVFFRIVSPRNVEETKLHPGLPDSLCVLTPPTVPTFSRSSWTPTLDALLFRRWFERIGERIDWKRTMLWVMLPHWWYGFVDRKMCPARFVVYDHCDALEMASRTQGSLLRMKLGEKVLANEAECVTYSAKTMEEDLDVRLKGLPRVFLPNATSDEFLRQAPGRESKARRPVIGYSGALDEKRIDFELIAALANRFEDCDLVIVSGVPSKLAESVSQFKNVRWHISPSRWELAQIVSQFDVGIIPFKNNPITRVINPLKLYEYCSAGVPIVATRTKELEHYSDLVYLANGEDEFISCVRRALEEDDPKKRQLRREFARRNTWEVRVDSLLELLGSLEGSNRLETRRDTIRTRLRNC